MNFILFAIGFLFLIQGADWLVGGASAIAKKFKIPTIVIGLTIVSFGTSLPELIVNITASMNDSHGIAIGNVIGSNIANILLILGITAIVSPLNVKKSTTYFEIPFSLIITLLLFALVNWHFIIKDSFIGLSRPNGIIFLILQVAFTIYIFKRPEEKSIGIPEEEDSKISPKLNDNLKMIISKTATITGTTKTLKLLHRKFFVNESVRLSLSIISGIVFLALGGKWTVSGAVGFASDMGVSMELIGYTIVAVGTCLPELITSVLAAIRKNADIAVGNIVGSLIFNVLWVLGLSATISPIPFIGEVNNNHDLIILLGSTLLLFVFVGINSKYVISRFEGVIFLILYVAYTIYLIMRG